MRSYLKNLPDNTRKIIATCFIAFFFNGTLSMMIGSLLPDLKAAYGLSDTQIGLMLSGHSAGNLIASLLSGLVPLWLGRRRSITLLSAASALGFSMMLVSGNPVWLILAFAFSGIGRGSVGNFNNYTINTATGGSPTASNLLHSFFAVGAIGAPLLFLLAVHVDGWQAAVVLVAVIGTVVSFAFSRLRLPQDRPDRRDQTQKSLIFLQNRTYLILGGMMFFICAQNTPLTVGW